jgi:hypothetical protein
MCPCDLLVPAVLNAMTISTAGFGASRGTPGPRPLAIPAFAREFLLITLSCACSPSKGEVVMPFPLGQMMVFGRLDDGTMMSFDDGCDTQLCRTALERCGRQAYADVVVDDVGDVLDVVCYPGALRVQEVSEFPADALIIDSDSVVVFDSMDDGADVLSDVRVTENQVVLYGQGADVSILGQSLDLDGPGTVVRALRVRGDLTIDGNGAKLSLVEVDGALTINGDRATVSESVVHGPVHLIGNDTVLGRNLLQGVDHLSGSNLICHLNQRFDDANRDGWIDDTELGGEVACN